MGIFDFLWKKNPEKETVDFNSPQFQNEIFALALTKLQENELRPDLAIAELKKLGLTVEQIEHVLGNVNRVLENDKAKDIENQGIAVLKFDSKEYQAEILNYAQNYFFVNKQSYEITEEHLQEEGLNKNQAADIVLKLRNLNAQMVTDFQSELDSGAISGIKIIPNEDHTRENAEPDQVDKYIGYGAYQMERGDLDNALELFDKAIELDEKATLAYANKGTLYSKKDDNVKALYFYNRALELEPDNVQILENKMEVLFEMLNETTEPEFIETVKSILKNDGSHPNALIYIIQFHLKQNEIEKALESVKMLFADYFREHIAIKLLLTTFHLLTKERALSEFENFKISFDEHARYQLAYCKGMYLMRIDDYDEAILQFEENNKTHLFSWNYYQIAIIKNKQGKSQECFDNLRLTFELEPELKEDARQYPGLQNLWTDSYFIELTS